MLFILSVFGREKVLLNLSRLPPHLPNDTKGAKKQRHELLSLRSPGGILLPLILFIWELIILPEERATRYFASICHCQQALGRWQ